MYGYIDSEDAIAAQLAAADAARDVTETRKLMKRVLQLSAARPHSTHHSSLLPHVVKLLALPDVIVKKLASWYLLEASHHQDLLLLAVNTLLKDARDANPMIRGQALHTLVSFRQTDLTQYAISPVMAGLHDQSVYVRRVAVTGCMKLYKTHPVLVSESGVVDTLYTMIRDSDPLVVSNSLSALDVILSGEGGVVINRNIAVYLLNHLAEFTDWGLVTVFTILHRYTPVSEEEVLDILNLADRYLHHHLTSVVYSCLRYFLHLVSHLPHLSSHVYNRARPHLITALSAGNHELTAVLLQYISSILDDHQDGFIDNYRAFFCKYSEPDYVKQMKISLLPRLATDDSCREMIDELHLYCTDLNVNISRCAITALAGIAQTVPSRWSDCVDQLTELLTMNIDYVTCHVLEVCQGLDLRQYERLGDLLSHLPPALHLLTPPAGHAAIWWMVGEYGDVMDDVTYLLEAASRDVITECDVQLQMMTAAVKLFIKSPGDMQDCLGHVLQTFSESKDQDVRDRVDYYYNLLATDINLVRHLVVSPQTKHH